MDAARWSRVDRVFHAALARALPDRPAFLADACEGDDDLRREVDSLLEHAGHAADFLERPAFEEAARQLTCDADDPGDDPQLPGYLIQRKIGEGGMGVVYLAEQLVPIRRPVALKLIRLGMSSREVIARFDVERQALALMQHPHIAAVFDAGTAPDGRPYFVMEYVDGLPITTYADRHRLTMRERLALFADVSTAVQHAHQKGIIHRDLKPSNVLVSDADGRAHAKVIDFGVAKAIARPLSAHPALTELGMLVGTPEYMSPEQAALSPDIDTATDVYSLGVLLYELLVGVLPFDPASLRAAGYDEMRRVIRESEPPKPSTRVIDAAGAGAAAARQTDVHRLSRQLQGDLDWITLKALSKDRRQRYATVADFAADIARYLAHEPVVARPVSAFYRARKLARRHRGLVAGVAAVVTALAGGLAVSVAQYRRAETERVNADQQRAQASIQRSAAEISARDADRQRQAALIATDEANRQRLAAMAQADAATAALREVQYRAYVSTIGAASAELRLNMPGSARDRLLKAPAHLRGWEWDHLFLKTDTSLATLTSTTPCAPRSDVPLFTESDRVLSWGEDGRLELRRCATLDSWDAASRQVTTHRLPGRILAVGASSAVVVRSPPASDPGSGWALEIRDPATTKAPVTLGRFRTEPLCADLSPDGARLAVGFAPPRGAMPDAVDDVFEVWDVHAMRRLIRMTPPRAPVADSRVPPGMSCMVGFNPDGTRVATSGARVHVWRSDAEAVVASDAGQAGVVSQPIAWSHDGARLAIGRLTGLVDILVVDATPHVEPLDGGALIRPLPMPDGIRRLLVQGRRANAVLTLAYTADDKHLLSGMTSGIGVWDLAAGRLSHLLQGHRAPVVGIAADRAGRVASADTSGEIKLWPATLAGATQVLTDSASPAGFSLSADGRVAGVRQIDGGLHARRFEDLYHAVLRAGTGRAGNGSGPPNPNFVRSLTLTPDGQFLLSADNTDLSRVKVWSVAASSLTARTVDVTPVPGCNEADPRSIIVDVMEASPDGRALAIRQGPCVVIRDLVNSTVLAVAPRSRNIRTFTFLADSTIVFYAEPLGDRRPTIGIWDWRLDRIRAQAIVSSNTAGVRQAWRLTAAADGNRIALFSLVDGTILVWDGRLRGEPGRLSAPRETRSAAFSRDGRRLASSGYDSMVHIWDVDRRELLLILEDDDRHYEGVGFTDDGRLVVDRISGGLTIWNSRPPR